MGGGNPPVQQTQDTSTRVETTTNATIGDVGLTGKDAVEFAKALSDSAVKLVQTVGSGYQPLVAGAGNVLSQQGKNGGKSGEKTIFKSLEDNAVLIAVVAGAITLYMASR